MKRHLVDVEILELSLGFWVVGSSSRRGCDAKLSRWVSVLPLHTTTEILIYNMNYTQGNCIEFSNQGYLLAMGIMKYFR